MALMRRPVSEEEGQGLVEYALIIGLIAVVVIVALTATGTNIQALFQNIADKLAGTGTP
mgnify:FL=1